MTISHILKCKNVQTKSLKSISKWNTVLLFHTKEVTKWSYLMSGSVLFSMLQKCSFQSYVDTNTLHGSPDSIKDFVKISYISRDAHGDFDNSL